jgi:hypothetical protein
MARSGHRHVSRIDQPEKNNHGWYVRVRREGATTSKFFRDSKYGTQAKALRGAIAFRDELLKHLSLPPSKRKVALHTGRNTSGIVGVARRTMRRRDGRSGGSYWVATWSPGNGKTARKLFSIAELGERGALLAACACRRDREREIYGEEIKENWAAAAKVLLNL